MNELFDFMLEKIGGLEKAKQELLRSKLAELDILGMTVSELLETARRDGWDDLLRNLTLEQFSEIFEEAERIAMRSSRPVEKFTPPPRRKPPLGQSRSRVRAIKERAAATVKVEPIKEPEPAPPVVDVAALQRQSILKQLGDHPWSYREELKKGSDLPDDDFETRLQELLNQGLVRAVPSDEGERYALG